MCVNALKNRINMAVYCGKRSDPSIVHNAFAARGMMIKI